MRTSRWVWEPIIMILPWLLGAAVVLAALVYLVVASGDLGLGLLALALLVLLAATATQQIRVGRRRKDKAA